MINPTSTVSIRIFILFLLIVTTSHTADCQNTIRRSTTSRVVDVNQVIERVRIHDFNPLNIDNSMTIDSVLQVAGIADLKNIDWQVRLLAVRDLVRAGNDHVEDIINGLADNSIHVRQICAMALGIIKSNDAIKNLEQVALNDKNTIVRSQAVIALGQIESKSSLGLLHNILINDPSRDVRHQCEIAIYQIEKEMGTTDKHLSAYLNLDESTFESVHTGDVAPNFRLDDTEGKEWQLKEFKNNSWVVLIWVFADWCPVCHGEFQDLMEMQDEFEKAGVKVFTVEAHDEFRGRVMVGKEIDPSYWFAKDSFKKTYTDQIKWPHLLDHAGAIGAMFGADPLAFAVHAEYINRPTTVIIDMDGIVQFEYQGTFWGDRPTIEQTLKMIETNDFSFEHPQRLNNL
jgi:peroxiredoxin